MKNNNLKGLYLLYILLQSFFTLHAQAPFYTETNIFDKANSNYTAFSTTGLFVSDAQTIFAYTDARYGLRDGSPSEILLKRSADGGQTWSSSVVMADTVSWKNNLTSSMFQAANGTLFFLHAKRGTPTNPYSPTQTKVFIQQSQDDGQTFTTPTDITAVLQQQEADIANQISLGQADSLFINEDPYDYTRNFFVPSPNAGITLSYNTAHPNRILVPFYAIKTRNFPNANPALGKFGLMFIKSDDNGQTWQGAGTLPIDDYIASEAVITELSDGRIILNARSNTIPYKATKRLIGYSNNGGDSWGKLKSHESEIPLHNFIHAGLYTYSNPLIDPNQIRRVLFSYIHHQSYRRQNLRVCISYDDHDTWANCKDINTNQPASSSNLSVLNDTTILLLYANGDEDDNYPDGLTLARFNLEWLTNCQDNHNLGPNALQTITTDILDNNSALVNGSNIYTSSTANDYYGSDYYYIPSSAANTDISWQYIIPETGFYQAQVFYPTINSPDNSVNYTFSNTRSSIDKVWNQATKSGQWRSVGTLFLEAGDTAKLHLNNNASSSNSFLLIDAARFVLNKNTEIIIDNHEAYKTAGAWETWTEDDPNIAAYNYYYQDYYTTYGFDTIRWEATIPYSGYYDVSFWLPKHFRAGTDYARYYLVLGGNKDSIVISQNNNRGAWINLGRHYFELNEKNYLELVGITDDTYYVLADAVKFSYSCEQEPLSNDSTCQPCNLEENITLFPNPNNGYFRLKFPDNFNLRSIKSVSLFNNLGQLVYHTKDNDNLTEINVIGLSTGLYHIGIKTKNELVFKKVVIGR